MRFEYYHAGLDNIAKLSVDGTVANSIHFSHWQGNQTPYEVKADTSTEIALNLVASPNRNQLTHGIELVTNNHFDTDGVLSVWTVLTGERATELHDELISAAEAGDFSELSSEQGVRTSIVIQGSDQASPNDDTGSPLARHLAGEHVDDEARAYEIVLPEVERVLRNVDEYEFLWHDAWVQVATALDSFEAGRSQVLEYSDQLSLITLAPEIFSTAGFSPTRHAPPYTAISNYARGQLFLITTAVKDGWVYRLDYPYYSWAETVNRPRIERRQDLAQILEHLNLVESAGEGRWQLDQREMTSAAKFLNRDATLAISKLEPDEVATVFARQRQFSVTGS